VSKDNGRGIVSISMEIGVHSPDMEVDEVVKEEPKPRRSRWDSLHLGNFMT
jgi:hypothetical protein